MEEQRADEYINIMTGNWWPENDIESDELHSLIVDPELMGESEDISDAGMIFLFYLNFLTASPGSSALKNNLASTVLTH